MMRKLYSEIKKNILNATYKQATALGLLFLKNFLEDMSLFCGVTDSPVFGLLVMSALGFKARVDPSLVCFHACAQQMPQIHIWCHTC